MAPCCLYATRDDRARLSDPRAKLSEGWFWAGCRLPQPTPPAIDFSSERAYRSKAKWLLLRNNDVPMDPRSSPMAGMDVLNSPLRDAHSYTTRAVTLWIPRSVHASARRPTERPAAFYGCSQWRRLGCKRPLVGRQTRLPPGLHRSKGNVNQQFALKSRASAMAEAPELRVFV